MYLCDPDPVPVHLFSRIHSVEAAERHTGVPGKVPSSVCGIGKDFPEDCAFTQS